MVREPLITNIMWRNLLIQVCGFMLYFWSMLSSPLNAFFFFFLKMQAAYQVTVLLVLNFRGKSLLGLENDDPVHANKVKNTLIFNAFVLCQVSLLL